MIEGTLKAYLKFYYGCYLIVEKNNKIHEKTKSASIGHCVKELTKYNENFGILYKSMFHDISINHWRNIAYHHDYSVDGNQILVRYGKSSELLLSRAEVEKVIIAMDKLNWLKKISYAISLFDNSELLKGRTCKTDISEDSIVIFAVESAYLNGYEIIKYDEDEDLLKFFFKNKNPINAYERALNMVDFITKITNKNISFNFCFDQKLIEFLIDPFKKSILINEVDLT